VAIEIVLAIVQKRKRSISKCILPEERKENGSFLKIVADTIRKIVLAKRRRKITASSVVIKEILQNIVHKPTKEV